MFANVVKSANGVSSPLSVAESGVNKRSKVCDADSQGNVNINCKR
jgi:hypothetical protein